MRDPSGREIIRSRTAMSYAFEAAAHGLIAREGSSNSRQGDIVEWVSDGLRGGFTKSPAWTVSKKDERR